MTCGQGGYARYSVLAYLNLLTRDESTVFVDSSLMIHSTLMRVARPTRVAVGGRDGVAAETNGRSRNYIAKAERAKADTDRDTQHAHARIDHEEK